MGLVEMVLGLLATAVAAPWVGMWGLKGYRRYMAQLAVVSAESNARDSFKPIQQERAEELTALVHRQEVAKNTAYAIQAEAALALTEATIESALSSGDLSLAKQGIQLALPSNGNAYAQQSPPQPMLESDVQQKLSAVQPIRMAHGVVNPNQNPFSGRATDLYLTLLRNGRPVPGVAGNVGPGEYLDGHFGPQHTRSAATVDPAPTSGELLDVQPGAESMAHGVAHAVGAETYES